MAKSITFLVFIFGLCAANAFSQSPTVTPREAQALCNSISRIKQLPQNDENGVDAVFDRLAKAGEAVVPCLIEKVADTKIMSDPRCPTISTETKVGDVAYFVLVRITQIGFTELFPADVQEKYKTEGVYAYHEYIEQKGKRKELQSKLREWYKKRQNALAFAEKEVAIWKIMNLSKQRTRTVGFSLPTISISSR